MSQKASAPDSFSSHLFHALQMRKHLHVLLKFLCEKNLAGFIILYW